MAREREDRDCCCESRPRTSREPWEDNILKGTEGRNEKKKYHLAMILVSNKSVNVSTIFVRGKRQNAILSDDETDSMDT